MKYKIQNVNGTDSVVSVFVDGELHLADSSHRNFDTIVSRLLANPEDAGIVDLFDVGNTVARAFEQLTPRVAVSNGEVLLDGNALHNSVSKQILRFLDEGLNEELMAVVHFAEKVMANPSDNSREQLFAWLDKRDFTILPNGNFVGYKGVNSDLTSVTSGASSDGVTVNGDPAYGNISNQPGAVVEMPRANVEDDPKVPCHRGLHVGNHRYASGFGSVTLEVHVNPTDVVSVPHDSDSEKIRTCRYTVVGPVESEYRSAFLASKLLEHDCEECDDDLGDDLEDNGCGFANCDCCDDFDDSGNEFADYLVEAPDVSYQLKADWTVHTLATPGVATTNSTNTAPVKTDTKLNHVYQDRYPKGHKFAGRFMPKDA